MICEVAGDHCVIFGREGGGGGLCRILVNCWGIHGRKESPLAQYTLSTTDPSSLLSRFSLIFVFKGTVTRFCACAASWFLFWRTFFEDWLLVKKSSSIDPETPEKAIISVKSYLVHILYFCAREKCTKPYSLLSVFPQTDQVWRVMWTSGFYFCPLSSPVNEAKWNMIQALRK